MCSDLYNRWTAWCLANGHRVTSAQTFGRDLRAVVPALRVVQHRDAAGKEPRYYVGLSLSPGNNGPVRVSPRVSDFMQPQPYAPQLVTRDDTRVPPLSAVDQNGQANGQAGAPVWGGLCTQCGKPAPVLPLPALCWECRVAAKGTRS
jgi:hypothetical protein